MSRQMNGKTELLKKRAGSIGAASSCNQVNNEDNDRCNEKNMDKGAAYFDNKSKDPQNN